MIQKSLLYVVLTSIKLRPGPNEPAVTYTQKKKNNNEWQNTNKNDGANVEMGEDVCTSRPETFASVAKKLIKNQVNSGVDKSVPNSVK